MAKVRKSKPDYQAFLAIFDKKWTKSTQKWPKIDGFWAILDVFPDAISLFFYPFKVFAGFGVYAY